MLHVPDGVPVVGVAGQTLFVSKGTRFRPSFPQAGTEYVPVCVPAFKPERCIREDGQSEANSAVGERLKELHGTHTGEAAAAAADVAGAPLETLYHMCPKEEWEAAKKSGKA